MHDYKFNRNDNKIICCRKIRILQIVFSSVYNNQKKNTGIFVFKCKSDNL